jgi:hypothetical protein
LLCYNERFLRQNDQWIKWLTGLTAAQFWPLFAEIEQDFADYERERLQRADRKRAVGAGNTFTQPLLLRVVAVLSYLRLHLPQEFTAAWFGMRQDDISRDLRRLLPLIQRHLPVPMLLEPLAELRLWLQELLAILDATEQAIERPADDETQQEYYSGKKKRHTVKTQVLVNAQGEVAAITPAEPGKTADIEIAKTSRVVERLPEGTQVYDDKGYVGLDKGPVRVPRWCRPKSQRSQSQVGPRGPRKRRSLGWFSTRPPRNRVAGN